VASDTSENVAIGEIIGYGRVYNPFSKKSKVIVKANDRVIRVQIDYRQRRYIEKVHRVGDKVAVGFYGGEWHIGSPPDHSNDYSPERDISDLDLLQYELKGLDLLELAVRPLSARYAEQLHEGEPDNAVEADDVETLKQKAVANLILSEIDERRGYIHQVEHDIKKNNDLILESLEKLNDHGSIMAMPSPDGEPDNAIEADDVETLKQKAVINLLLSEIDEHRDYLKEIEQDVRKNSDAILEDLGLSHLKENNEKKKLKQQMASEDIKTADEINLENIKRLDQIITQNNEIISKLDEITSFLKETMPR
jgi:hypothetical protein